MPFPMSTRRAATCRWKCCRLGAVALQMGKNKQDEEARDPSNGSKKKKEEKTFREEELAGGESLEKILEELEALEGTEVLGDGDDDDDFFLDYFDEETLEELFLSLPPDFDNDYEDENDDEEPRQLLANGRKTVSGNNIQSQSTSLLENALLQGVVPASAGVGSNCMTGDFGFDPMDLASKDYFPRAQAFFKNLIPPREGTDNTDEKIIKRPASRPKALILRDYREAELRHGRLAMIAAIFWPLQELLDRLVLPEEKFDSLLYSLFFGGVTLPYFPLLMTAIMLLLGYLDVYSVAIKDVDGVGEAYLPGGECPV
jgi:Chlorophyll A-B binding protein